jgi:hypothetical protein
MLRARVYTENKNLQALCQIASGYFDSYSVIGCGGVWEGKHEPAVIFEILRDTTLRSMTYAVEDFGHDVKDYNKQEAVLYTIDEVTGGTL